MLYQFGWLVVWGGLGSDKQGSALSQNLELAVGAVPGQGLPVCLCLCWHVDDTTSPTAMCDFRGCGATLLLSHYCHGVKLVRRAEEGNSLCVCVCACVCLRACMHACMGALLGLLTCTWSCWIWSSSSVLFFCVHSTHSFVGHCYL